MNYLDFAQKTAVEAGAILRDNLGNVSEIEFKGKNNLLTEVDKLSEETIIRRIRHSFPSHDILAEESGINRSEVVFCGDSGNDLHPLTAGFCGVLVKNADDQLVAGVRKAIAVNPGLKVYFAKGDCRGLNGFYTGGVIEGAYHYGLFHD